MTEMIERLPTEICDYSCFLEQSTELALYPIEFSLQLIQVNLLSSCVRTMNSVDNTEVKQGESFFEPNGE